MKVGDRVLVQDMKNVGRKGGKLAIKAPYIQQLCFQQGGEFIQYRMGVNYVVHLATTATK